MVKASNSAGEAKCFASLVVKALSDKHVMKTRLIEEAHTVRTTTTTRHLAVVVLCSAFLR